MLINIQFLRFVAAMLVVLYHTSAHLRSVGLDQGLVFGASEAVGFAGVDVFFVISGFIMAWTTRAANGMADAWQFVRRRFARIYSGYWPFFVLAVLVFIWANPALYERADLVESAFLWPTPRLLLAVSWTLIFELFFYLCFTLLIGFSRGHHTRVLVASLLLIAAWSVYSQFFREAYAPGNLEQMHIAEYYMASPYLAEFVSGALVATWMIKRPNGLAWPWLLAGLAGFFLGGLVNNRIFDSHIEQGYWVFYRVIVFGGPALMALVGLVRLEKIGVVAPLRFSLVAGGASYAIYLSHTIILTATQYMGFNDWARQFSPAIAQGLFLGLAMAMLAYSVAHYRWIERPVHHLFLKLAGVGRSNTKQ